DLVHRFVNGEVERPQVNDLELAFFLRRIEVEAEPGGALDILGGDFLEDGDDARLALAQSLGNELRAEHRLARAGRPGQEHAVPLGNSAAHQGVELADAGGETPL